MYMENVGYIYSKYKYTNHDMGLGYVLNIYRNH